MTPSTDLLEEMGFKEIVRQGDFTARFESVTVFEAEGIKLPNGFSEAREAHIAGTDYRIALSEGVNSGCKKLLGDDFTESESEWLKTVKTSGPFVLVAVALTEFSVCEAGRMKRMPDGNINTYNSFPSVREALLSLEKRVLPPIIAALTLALNESDYCVVLRKVDRGSVGRMPNGTMVYDTHLEAKMKMTVSRMFGEMEAIQALDDAVKRGPTLHQRAAEYFALGTAEVDRLKRFLYFFLSLEVETHATFGRIDHFSSLGRLITRDGTHTSPPNTIALIARDISKWGNLFDRFVWCATCAWTNIGNDDISLFKELKKARDAIAHGRVSEPPSDLDRKAELLAHKVLWMQTRCNT